MSRRVQWRAVVFSTGLVSATVKVTLLALADHMSADGYVSVPLERMSEQLKRGPRSILRHYADAIDVGLLDRVSQGHDGHTALYRATFPKRIERVTTDDTL